MKKLSYLLIVGFLGCNHPENSDEMVTSGAEQNKPKMEVVDSLSKLVQIPEGSQKAKWTFDRVKGSNILFKEGHVFNTKLYDLEYIGQINIDKYPPFLIYSGRDCNECDANIAIYFHSPRNGKLDVSNGKNSYSYPGRVRHYLSDSVIFEARTFYGEVLRGTYGVIWFRRELMDNNSVKSSAFLTKLKDGKIVEEDLKDHQKLTDETFALNKTGKYTEIKGKDMTSEP